MIKIGIIGGAGYTAGELIRLLLNHPDAEITFVNSTSNAGNKITDVHSGFMAKQTWCLPTSFHWNRSICFSSVPLTATRKSLWKAIPYPKT